MEKFNSLGSNPNSPDYIKPSDNDVWEFLSHIKKWIDNPEKLGLG